MNIELLLNFILLIVSILFFFLLEKFLEKQEMKKFKAIVYLSNEKFEEIENNGFCYITNGYHKNEKLYIQKESKNTYLVTFINIKDGE